MGFNCFHYFFPVHRVHEKSPSYRGYFGILLLRGGPGYNLVPPYQQPVVNHVIDVVFLRHNQCPVALSGPAGPDQGYNLHRHSPRFHENQTAAL